MSLTWTLVLAAGVTALFWLTGARSRLARLRKQAVDRIVPVLANLGEQAHLAQTCLPDALSADCVSDLPASLEPRAMPAPQWSNLASAARQLTHLLQASGTGAVEPVPLAAVHTAWQVLETAWRRIHTSMGDLADPVIPDHVRLQCRLLEQQLLTLSTHYNAAASLYNEAIAQFPASLLSALLKLRPCGVWPAGMLVALPAGEAATA